MSILKLDGVDLYYEVHGDGDPVVFIHGASGTHLTWWRQVEELRKRFTCVTFDQRGFGNSRPTAPYDVGDVDCLYQDLRALIGNLGFGEVKIGIVGASMGTATALRYATLHPELINRLLLVCGPGSAETPLTIAGWERRAAGFQARSQDLNRANAQPLSGEARDKWPRVQSPGEVERFAAARHPFGPVGEALHLDDPAHAFLYAEIMALAGGPPTSELMPVFTSRPLTPHNAAKLTFPVLVVGGSEDNLFRPDELAEVAGMFPKGRFEVFPGAGHAAYYEKPRRFNNLLSAFLKDNDGSARGP